VATLPMLRSPWERVETKIRAFGLRYEKQIPPLRCGMTNKRTGNDNDKAKQRTGNSNDKAKQRTGNSNDKVRTDNSNGKNKKAKAKAKCGVSPLRHSR
jgi:hypothetical protein